MPIVEIENLMHLSVGLAVLMCIAFLCVCCVCVCVCCVLCVCVCVCVYVVGHVIHHTWDASGGLGFLLENVICWSGLLFLW